MYVSDALKRDFKNREQAVLRLIDAAGLQYVSVGVFGSYAREEYKTSSDIDFCVIVNERPPRTVTGPLRDDAEELGAEIIFVSSEYFEKNSSLFARNLRRDFRRLR